MPDILLIEDNPGDARLVELNLLSARNLEFELHTVPRLGCAVELLHEGAFDLIVSDLSLPDSRGVDTLKALLEFTDIPVIVLTGLDDERTGLEAVRSGAQDYLVKSDLSPQLLTKSILYAQERARLQTELAAELTFDALHDPLTGLKNRAALMASLEHAIAHMGRYPEHTFALLFIDLDGFKAVNDTFGHAAGDDILIEVAKGLTASVRNIDTVARLGGDEFVILLRDMKQEEHVERVRDQVLKRISFEVGEGEKKRRVSASIGHMMGCPEDTDPNACLERADRAMYHVKERNRASYLSAS